MAAKPQKLQVELFMGALRLPSSAYIALPAELCKRLFFRKLLKIK
jgi:hypothetical protein